MNQYKGLFTYDIDNHRYVPVEQADGIISGMNYHPEHYEEPLEPYWFLNDLDGKPIKCDPRFCGKSDFIEWRERRKKIGNKFETEEEAEKATEKLKAWTRLKDKGFKFNGVTPMGYFIRFTYDKPRQILDNQQHPEIAQQFNEDIKLLFGDEE